MSKKLEKIDALSKYNCVICNYDYNKEIESKKRSHLKAYRYLLEHDKGWLHLNYLIYYVDKIVTF